jgi:proteasome activator subunit 4
MKSIAPFLNSPSPYQNIRYGVARILHEYFQLKWRRSFNSAAELISSKGSLIPSPQYSILDEFTDDYLKSLVKKTPNSNLYINQAKFILLWFGENVASYRSSAILCLCSKVLIPSLDMVENPDTELQTMSASFCNLYSSLLQTSDIILPSVTQIVLVLKSPCEWQRKIRVLNFLQAFFFRNFPLLSAELKKNLLTALSDLLENANLEVRNLASISLSGLIRCCERHDIIVYLDYFSQKLKLNTQSETLIKRHGAVLGLSALVQAFPYEIPSWIPKTLVLLSSIPSNPTLISVFLYITIVNNF